MVELTRLPRHPSYASQSLQGIFTWSSKHETMTMNSLYLSLLITFIAILQGLITTFCFGTAAARKASSAAFGFYSCEAILGQQFPHHHGTFRPQSRVCVYGIVFLLVYGRSRSPGFSSCWISFVNLLSYRLTHFTICIFPWDLCHTFRQKFAYRA